jgi:hypothetical protein
MAKALGQDPVQVPHWMQAWIMALTLFNDDSACGDMVRDVIGYLFASVADR